MDGLAQSQRRATIHLLLGTACCVLLLEGLLRVPPIAGHFEQIAFNEVALKNRALAEDQRRGKPTPALLAFGTSRTGVALIPATVDAELRWPDRSFNLGVSSGPILVHRFWLEQYIRRHGVPRLVLLEVPVFSLNRNFHDDTDQYYRSVAEDHPLAFVTGMLAAPVPPAMKREILLSTAFNVYRYRAYLGPLTLQKAWTAPRSPYNDRTYEEGWFKGAPSLTPEQRRQQLKDYREKVLADYDVNLDEARAFLAYARDQGVPVALVQWPVSRTLQGLYEDLRIYPPYVQAIGRLQDEYRVPFINLHDLFPDMRDREDLFLDIHHLNPRGAEAMSRALAQSLQGLRAIPSP